MSCILASGYEMQQKRIEWYRKLVGMIHQDFAVESKRWIRCQVKKIWVKLSWQWLDSVWSCLCHVQRTCKRVLESIYDFICETRTAWARSFVCRWLIPHTIVEPSRVADLLEYGAVIWGDICLDDIWYESKNLVTMWQSSWLFAWR